MARILFFNTTTLSDQRLLTLFADGLDGWSTGTITVRVRYSRGADFSGTCFYTDRRIHINLGRHLKFPYLLATHLAKAVTRGRRWTKPVYTMELADLYQLAAFIFMHELYHLLVKRAKRNIRQKESMCDRFAARYLIDRFSTPVIGPDRAHVPRAVWDFQDLNGFVAAARDLRHRQRPAARRPRQADCVKEAIPAQGLLFPE